MNDNFEVKMDGFTATKNNLQLIYIDICCVLAKAYIKLANVGV